MSRFEIVNPAELGAPRGFSHGLVAPAGARLLFVAGQTAAAEGTVRDVSFVAQFEAALVRVLAVVRAAGGQPGDVARMTVYVVNLESYLTGRARLGEVWRRHMGAHFPAMAVVEVTKLVDAMATVEIEATAVLS